MRSRRLPFTGVAGPFPDCCHASLSGWAVNAGVFTRISGGAPGSTAFSLHSRTPVIDNDCNPVISPVIVPRHSL